MNPVTSSALCLGHPGHEIKVLAWAARHRPVVTILTDGSGPDRPSRLDSTRKVLETVGCRFGSIFGSLTDREIYEMMREGPSPFVEIAARLEKEWNTLGVTTVVGDALEGFSPTHDVCRMIINSVVKRGHGNQLNYSFPLEGLVTKSGDAVVTVELDDKMFEWKKAIVSELYPEMVGEVARAVERYGEGPFRAEILHAEPPGKERMLWQSQMPPFYETYGVRQIEKGHYQHLITYRDHLLPIAEGLWDWACQGS